MGLENVNDGGGGSSDDDDSSGDSGGGHRVVVGESVQDSGMTSGCPQWRMARSRDPGSISGEYRQGGQHVPLGEKTPSPSQEGLLV